VEKARDWGVERTSVMDRDSRPPPLPHYTICSPAAKKNSGFVWRGGRHDRNHNMSNGKYHNIAIFTGNSMKIWCMDIYIYI